MFQKSLFIIIFSALAFTMAALAAGEEGEKAVNGGELYRLNCSACHGLDKKGNPPVFPSLLNLAERMDSKQVSSQIRNGKNAMPPMSHLTDRQVEAIVAYVLENKNESVSVDENERGAMLVSGNCMRCHRVKPGDPAPPEARMMEPPMLSRTVRWHDSAGFKAVLDVGPCYMPSFEDMPDSDKDNIYRYLSSIPVDSSFNADRGHRGCRMQRGAKKSGRCGDGRCGGGKCGGMCGGGR